MTKRSRKLYSLIWEIENFSLCSLKNSEFICSPHFTIKTLNHSKWFIMFYPNGNSQNKDYVSIFLYRDDDISAEEITIDYKLELVDGNGISLYSLKEKNKKFAGRENFGSPDSMKCDFLTEVMENWKENVLTIRCDISSGQCGEDELITSGCKAITKIGSDQISSKWNLTCPDSPSWKKKKTFLLLSVQIEIILTAPGDAFEIYICKVIGFSAEPRPILCRFSLLDVKRNEVVSKWDSHLFDSSELDTDIWKFPIFLTKKMLEDGKDDFLQKNMFTLKCEICLANETSTTEYYEFQSLPEEISMPEINVSSPLLEDLRNMFNLKKHCDVKLQFENETIPAHKAILAARSPVFSAMFDQDMLENQTGAVNIGDVDASTMHVLLEFMYTGAVKKLDNDNASTLLMAADKYEILSLKQKCSEYFASILSVANVCDVLSMAAVIDEPLKVSAMDYIVKNFDEIMSLQKWPNWVKNNHELTTEVFLKLSKRMKNVLKNK